MRVSSNQFYQTGLHAIVSQQSELLHLYQQLGSGRRMITPADDPLAAAQAVNLSQSQSLNQRFLDNRSVARRNLGTEENTLASMALLLQNIKTTLVEAGNGTLSDQDRATLGNVLSGARHNLLGLANATDGNGQYLFSGSRGEVAAFQEDDGRIVYCGDTLQRNIQADPTRHIAGSDIGSDILQRAAPGATGFFTRAAETNTGTGLVGKPGIIDSHEVQAGSTFVLTFTEPTRYRVEIIDEEGNSSLVRADSLYIAGAENTLNLSAGVQIVLSGEPQRGDVFFVEPREREAARLSIFDTLDSMIAALARPQEGNGREAARFSNMLASAIQRINSHYDNILTVRASVGARLNELDALDENSSQRSLGYSMHLSSLEDVDYYSASMRLQLRLSALEAASLAFRRIQSASLFSLIPD